MSDEIDKQPVMRIINTTPPEPTLEQRVEALERCVCDLAEQVRFIGQTMSWSSAGARLNNPPYYIRDGQLRIKAWFERVRDRLAQS